MLRLADQDIGPDSHLVANRMVNIQTGIHPFETQTNLDTFLVIIISGNEELRSVIPALDTQVGIMRNPRPEDIVIGVVVRQIRIIGVAKNIIPVIFTQSVVFGCRIHETYPLG